MKNGGDLGMVDSCAKISCFLVVFVDLDCRLRAVAQALRGVRGRLCLCRRGGRARVYTVRFPVRILQFGCMKSKDELVTDL